MCFISKFCRSSPALLTTDPHFSEPIPPVNAFKQESPADSSFQSLSALASHTHFLGNGSPALANLLAIVNFNSQLLLKLQQNVNSTAQMLEQAHSVLAESMLEQSAHTSPENSTGWQTKEPVIQKLFGERQYKYKLKLRHRLPATIYKERNLSLALELLDQDDKLVMNSNLINLCVACCDVSATWIPENEEGEYFMQGKTEVELYHGEALFHKLYPRDVSRQFQNGKIDVVIYPKPSLIKFSTSASNVEQVVRAEDVEPLLVKDITIRAKKKAQY